MTTAYITDSRYHLHTLPGHPECAERLMAIQKCLDESGTAARMLRLTPEPVGEAQILAVHTEDYLENVLKWSAAREDGVMMGADTYLLPQSYEIARLSAGGAVRAIDAILAGEAHNAYVAARPPGHHAIPDMGMGFCLLANVSIAARHAQARHGLKRIMIVDYDVHHGNGTQDIFYSDPDVLFLSSHQSPWYPGTGALEDTGEGKGRGATINVPLPAGVGDSGFAAVYERIVWPAAQRFQPELMIVSAGFDSHWRDPLGQLKLSVTGYAHLSRELIRMANALCDGRIVFVQEGGYHLEALSYCALGVCNSLLGDPTTPDPIGKDGRPEAKIDPLIERIRTVHGL